LLSAVPFICIEAPRLASSEKRWTLAAATQLFPCSIWNTSINELFLGHEFPSEQCSNYSKEKVGSIARSANIEKRSERSTKGKQMNAWTNIAIIVGRLLVAIIFVRGGINKLGSIDATAAQMAKAGIPLSNILVLGAIAMELGGGLLLMAGLFTRWAALALFLYTLTLALIFHAYWGTPDAEARMQASFFFGHLSMMGGMLVLAACGPGAYSLDELIRRKA
jgi:putative oxidoreductase